MSDAVRRIAALLRNRPGPETDDATRADWFDEKAAVFDEVADASPWQADDARQAAATARDEARRLRRATP